LPELLIKSLPIQLTTTAGTTHSAVPAVVMLLLMIIPGQRALLNLPLQASVVPDKNLGDVI
jgi:hypothetical protein